MDFPIDPDDRLEDAGSGPIERIMLGAIRLVSLTLLALVIVSASLIYGLASLVRRVATIVDGLHRPRGPLRTWSGPVEARDA